MNNPVRQALFAPTSIIKVKRLKMIKPQITHEQVHAHTDAITSC